MAIALNIILKECKTGQVRGNLSCIIHFKFIHIIKNYLKKANNKFFAFLAKPVSVSKTGRLFCVTEN